MLPHERLGSRDAYHRPQMMPQSMGRLVTRCSGTVRPISDAEAFAGPDGAVPLDQAYEVEARDLSLTERFEAFCEAESIDYRQLTAATRPQFAAAMHAFLIGDVANRAEKPEDTDVDSQTVTTPPDTAPYQPILVPRGLVGRALTDYYAKYGTLPTDTVKQEIRMNYQRVFVAAAQQYRKAFPEILKLNELHGSFYQNQAGQAQIAAIELKAAYGLALKKIVKNKELLRRGLQARQGDDQA